MRNALALQHNKKLYMKCTKTYTLSLAR